MLLSKVSLGHLWDWSEAGHEVPKTKPDLSKTLMHQIQHLSLANSKAQREEGK